MKSSSKNLAVPEISETMKDALRVMLGAADKSLHRWAGGFWGEKAPSDNRYVNTHVGLGQAYHGSSTINALIKRGLVEVAESRTGRNGTFPIQVRLNHLSYEALKCQK